MEACRCGNRTGGGQTPPPRGLTTLMGLEERPATEGMKRGEAAYVSGTVLYDDNGRLSVREPGREP